MIKLIFSTPGNTQAICVPIDVVKINIPAVFGLDVLDGSLFVFRKPSSISQEKHHHKRIPISIRRWIGN